MTVDIICADAREALARFPGGHFHCCVTSPPFWGLRDYGLEPTVWGGDGCEHEWGDDIPARSRPVEPSDEGSKQATSAGSRFEPGPSTFCRRCNAWRGTLGLEPTPELYVEHLVGVLREVRRVLRDDGTCWLNIGDSYASGKGTCYNPGGGDGSLGKLRKEAGAHPLDKGNKSTLTSSGLKPKDLVGVPWRVAFALQADGWWLRSDIVWSKPNPMPESVTDRPTRSHEYLFLMSKSARYFYDQDAVREPHTDESAKRYLRNSSYTGDPDATQYAMKQGPRGHGMPSQKWEADEADAIAPTWVKGHSGYVNADGHVMINEAGRNRRSVWEIATQPYPGAHFAVFPEKLVEPCILAGCPEGGKRCDCDELIATPLGSGPIEDPSLVTGRAGFNRPRRNDEGVRPITRREQRSYAAQMRDSPHRAEMATAAGSAFDHYVRTDNSGARPLPPELLGVWLERGWLVHPGPCEHPEEPPGVVLDPFAGSGTVGVVAERLGRHSVLIDAKEEYCEMARYRTAQRGLMVMTSQDGNLV